MYSIVFYIFRVSLTSRGSPNIVHDVAEFKHAALILDPPAHAADGISPVERETCVRQTASVREQV
jgi:hypothetical protein